MEISSLEFVSRLLMLPIAFAIDPLAPLLVFGLARRSGLIDDPYLLQPAFDAFATDGFLAVVAVLYVIHVLADKFPPAAHLLDALHLVAKPLAAALVGFWMVHKLDASASLHLVTLSVVILGSVTITAGVHVMRSTVRLAASAGSFGILVPFISAIENAVGLVAAVLLVLRPEVAIFLFLVSGIPIALLLLALMNRIRRRYGRVRNRRDRFAAESGSGDDHLTGTNCGALQVQRSRAPESGDIGSANKGTA